MRLLLRDHTADGAKALVQTVNLPLAVVDRATT